MRRGGGRVKLKLRPWMAEPLVVKEGDASLRLATDLPRFNWLEMKLNQKQPEIRNSHKNTATTISVNKPVKPVVVAATPTRPPPPPPPSAHPLKIRILETSEAAAAAAMTAAKVTSGTKRALPALIPTSLSMIPVIPPSSAQQPTICEGSSDGSDQGTSKWPLKKRLIRHQSGSTSPPISPVITPRADLYPQELTDKLLLR